MPIEEIRTFNRYYARILGMFDQKVFDSKYSMVEMRILGEISRQPSVTANALTQYLMIKKSYLSRMLSKLEKDGQIYRMKDPADSRVYHLYLTEAGQQLNAFIEERSNEKVQGLTEHLDKEELQTLVGAMDKITTILEKVVPNEMEEI